MKLTIEAQTAEELGQRIVSLASFFTGVNHFNIGAILAQTANNAQINAAEPPAAQEIKKGEITPPKEEAQEKGENQANTAEEKSLPPYAEQLTVCKSKIKRLIDRTGKGEAILRLCQEVTKGKSEAEQIAALNKLIDELTDKIAAGEEI